MIRVTYTNFPAQFEASRAALLEAVTRVFEKGDFILGKDVELFEQEFAPLCGAKHAISVANGTDALILALKALGIGAGDEVITPPNSWISSAASIALVGAKPVFADVQSDQNISPAAIEAAITPRTKAIMPVHLTGRCADLPRILEIASRRGIPVIEDAAQAVTATVGPFVAGGAGTIGCFSLHPLKNLNAAGDAGIITTNDSAIADRIRLLRNHGQRSRDVVVTWGYNSRLDTLQAAILRTRIPTLSAQIEQRRRTAARYIEAMSGVVECPIEKTGERHTYHVFSIQADRRDGLKEFLASRGIDTKIHYPTPIHLQEAAEELGYKLGSLPEVERQSKRILSIPIHTSLTDEQVDWVSESVRAFYH